MGKDHISRTAVSDQGLNGPENVGFGRQVVGAIVQEKTDIFFLEPLNLHEVFLHLLIFEDRRKRWLVGKLNYLV
jgi:hypothetical protein